MTNKKFIVGLSGGNDDYYQVPLNEHLRINFDPMNTPDLWRRTGRNLGNLVWAYASRQIFDNNVEFVELSKQKIDKGEMDLIALALANIFKDSERNEVLAKSMYDRLINTNIPIIVLSVGVQHKDTATFPKLGPECIKLLTLLSEKSLSIGVRGEFTKSCFIHYGVDASKIIKTGCPSILLNLNTSLGRDIQSRYLIRGSVATSMPSFSISHALSKKMLSIASLDGSCINVQSTPELLAAKRGELSSEKLSNLYTSIFSKEEPFDVVDNFFQNNVNYFNDLPNWFHAMKSYSRGISARIHGGIVMMTAGLPTVIIGIDSRVIELCETFYIPYISINEFMESSVDELFSDHVLQGELFDLNRKNISHRFINMLRLAGAPVSPALLKFSEE